MDKDINRIKVVLADKKRTNRWLAEQLGKDQATISKWCTNTSQPGLETLYQIAKLLEIEVQELLQPVDKVLGKYYVNKKDLHFQTKRKSYNNENS